MAQVLYFSRDTKFFVELPNVGAAGSTLFEIPILDGFNFSQATNSTEVTLAEMSAGGVSKRGRAFFNDSLAPVEFSFSTYVRPYKTLGSGTGRFGDTAGEHHAVEEVLWALMVGDASHSSANFQGFTRDTTDLDISFANSNVVELGPTAVGKQANIFLSLGTNKTQPKIYKIAEVVINEATLDFDIDGIATINWSGFGSTLTESSLPSGNSPNAYITEDITATDNFIRNRLTELAIDFDDSSTFPGASNNGVYNLTLTGGSVTITNNVTYITPETLGQVNTPIGHVTGGRSVSGSFTCYLNHETTGNDGTSSDFFADMTAATALTKITNKVSTTFKVGGATGTPRLELAMSNAHFEIPSHNIEEVIALETNFHALPSTIDEKDELTIKYVGKA